MQPIFDIKLNEPEGEVIRNVYPFEMTIDNLKRFYDNAKQFPALYGKEIMDNAQEFVDLFISYESDGNITMPGLLWVIDDFTGMFYLNNILQDTQGLVDANVHYTFFDRRHKGRIPLVRKMLKYVFEKYHFQRLSVEIPLYTVSKQKNLATIKFVSECGFFYEGKKRKASYYKENWYDVNLYGILHSEV